MQNDKFKIRCEDCGHLIKDFSSWFDQNQQCLECGSKLVSVDYSKGYEGLTSYLNAESKPGGLWYYFDYLPLKDRRNIVSFSEGIVPIDRWEFLERFAKERYGIRCKIYAHRYDLSPGTGTFKDLAGTVVSSVLNEAGRDSYVGASTGNIANAYSKYLAAAGILFYAFIPSNSSDIQKAGITAFGQKAFRVNGDYAAAKAMAAQFAGMHEMVLAAGNFDPMRIEAKKTMVYEWLRQLDEFPTVYVQALSGGTGPLGIKKAYKELSPLNLFNKIPRQLMVQSDQCAPMAMAWEEAKANDFPKGWETEYPVLKDPDTVIPTLSTGDPKTYPVLAPFVRDTGGEIFSCDETKAIDAARLVAAECNALIGPAAALPVEGVFESFKRELIHDGDVILLNVGENIGRSPDFLAQFLGQEAEVNSIEDCSLAERKEQLDEVWSKIEEIYS
jgi:threonine synthase